MTSAFHQLKHNFLVIAHSVSQAAGVQLFVEAYEVIYSERSNLLVN
jgi:hypothetical protein